MTPTLVWAAPVSKPAPRVSSTIRIEPRARELLNRTAKIYDSAKSLFLKWDERDNSTSRADSRRKARLAFVDEGKLRLENIDGAHSLA